MDEGRKRVLAIMAAILDERLAAVKKLLCFQWDETTIPIRPLQVFIVSLEPRVARFPDKMCSYNLDRELTSEQ